MGLNGTIYCCARYCVANQNYCCVSDVAVLLPVYQGYYGIQVILIRSDQNLKRESICSQHSMKKSMSREMLNAALCTRKRKARTGGGRDDTCDHGPSRRLVTVNNTYYYWRVNVKKKKCIYSNTHYCCSNQNLRGTQKAYIPSCSHNHFWF